MLTTTRSSAKALAASGCALALLAAAAPAAAARPAWDTSPASHPHQVRPVPKTVDLRVGEHRRFDRVVIDLDGKVPGYSVRYVRELTYDGSGRHVPLRGKRFLAVVLNPAKAHGPHGSDVYAGPDLQQYRFDALRGVAMTGDFEGHVSFGLALRHRADFRVLVLHAPNRIVVDLRR